MSKRPWMPLYIGDYLGDTAHLTAAQHGGYLLLIMHYWAHSELPRGDRALRRIACMTAWQWKCHRPVIAGFFTEDWKHKRIETELKKAVSLKSLKNLQSAESKNDSALSKSSNDINGPISHTSHPHKKEREDARARVKKYGKGKGRKGKGNGFKDALGQLKQSVARGERGIVEAEHGNPKGGTNIVRLLPDRGRK